MKKTPEQIVESIPEEDRGHVFHLLGKALGRHTGGGVTAQDEGSGDNYPKPGQTGPKV